ncbi:MAG: response regulator [Victivallales bacterium]|nr:response regulator [Victivallales bacterium]
MGTKKFMKTSDAASYLGVSRSSITNWVRQGVLSAASTPGGHYLFSREQLDNFAQTRGMSMDEPARQNAGYKILVIDDDREFREFASEALEVYSGYELKEAEDGMQGALLIGSWLPELVVVDLRMPNMNGVEFCRILKKNKATENVKIIIASAYLSPEIRQEINQLGVDSILEKPVRLASFVATIGKLTDLELS